MTTLYTPTAWAAGATPLSAANMNHLEAGVRGAVPVGSVIPSYGLHNGFLELNGATISRTTYPELFNWTVSNNLLGSGKPFGPGDGTTTFKLPTQAALGSLRFYIAT